MPREIGKIIMLAGVLISLAGAGWYFFGERLHWIGRLPGDVRIERGHVRFYFPFTSMLLLSLIIHLIIRLYRMIC